MNTAPELYLIYVCTKIVRKKILVLVTDRGIRSDNCSIVHFGRPIKRNTVVPQRTTIQDQYVRGFLAGGGICRLR